MIRSRISSYAVAIAFCLGGPGCATDSGGQGGGRLPKEARDTSDVAEGARPLVSTSARCPNGVCVCRPIDDYGRGDAATDAEDPPPAEGMKRFELRTGRGDDIVKITVEGMGTFTKAAGPEPGCIYVDLPPGAHRVRYHVIARQEGAGIEPRLRVSEYGAAHGRWYRTFAFRCGGGSGPCTKDDARDALAELGKVARGVHDPCGSTKVQGMRFYSERPADAQVSDFNLQFVLNVYKFAPRFPPDAESCKGVSFDASKSQ